MSGELPTRIFKEGEETQVTQINDNCRLVNIIAKLETWLPKELNEVKKDRVFSQIFKLHKAGIGYSARVIHSFLCRELVTYQMHQLWFVFARRPLRFSLVEFHEITGLECNATLSLKEFDEWEDDGGFWSKVLKRKEGICILTLWKKHKETVKKWSNIDRIRLVYLCITVCVVLARDEKANIPLKYIKVVMDLEKLQKYPWGVASFDLLCEPVAENDEEVESDEDFRTPKGSVSSSSIAKKGKKRLPDCDMKAFVAQLFQQNFNAMEERLHKQMDAKFEQMQSEFKDSLKDVCIEVEHTQPSSSNLSPSKPSTSKPLTSNLSPTKPSTSKPSPRRSKCGQVEDIYARIGTQGLKGLSQASYVPGFDQSQTNTKDEPRDCWTPMTTVRKLPKVEQVQESTVLPPPSQWEKWSKGIGKKLELSDSPMAQDGSPQSSLYYVSEETWNRFTEWSINPMSLQVGPICFSLTVNSRIVCAGKWLGNKMDAAYNKFAVDKKGYQLPEFLLSYGRGKIPSHGQTDQVWGVDVDRLYFPLFVNGNHWVAICVNIIEKKVKVFDCSRGRNRQYVAKFAHLIPRIVKAVGPSESKKQLLLSPYSIIDVPMKGRLKKSCCDCGAYVLKHLECHLLGLDLSLVDDEIIQGCRQKIGVELWEAAHDPVLAQVMKQYVPSPWETSEVFDLAED
ncbi:hypothetical protein N665_0059s0005 [Sinapis alba]|nr:hypothetical protein N665_0059s0005 [Sinapis alba]